MSFVQAVLSCGCNHYFTGKINSSYRFVGVMMKRHIQKKEFLALVAVFIVLPIFFYATGSIPRRTFLKESISILTILALCQMLAQFFLTRSNRLVLQSYTLGSIIKIHKLIGYFFISFLLVHPFLIVLPRYFEAGVDSKEAFLTIVTTFNSNGILLGICGWCLLLVLGFTSLLRKKLPLSYSTWRLLHGFLAVISTILGSWHAINLGRHTTAMLSSYVVVVAVGGILPLIMTYISQSQLQQGVSK